MKKIVFGILLSMFTLTSFAQNSQMLEDGRIWAISNFTFDSETGDDGITRVKWSGKPVDGSQRYLTIKGDTVVNGKNYKKLYSVAQTNSSPGGGIFLFDLIRCDNGRYMYYFVHEAERKAIERGVYSSLMKDGEMLLFDENLKVGDLEDIYYDTISFIGDTIFPKYSANVNKYWLLSPECKYNHISSLFVVFDNIRWVVGVGAPTGPLHFLKDAVDCPCYNVLLYCVAANGDTIYKNPTFYNPTLNVSSVTLLDVSFSQRGGECVVTLPCSDAWSATLYNSVGVVVARRSGEGSEIVLPATSKGTHIFVLNVGGRVVKKKVFIK